MPTLSGFFYLDLLVTCAATNSTERYNLVEKFSHYHKLALEEYEFSVNG